MLSLEHVVSNASNIKEYQRLDLSDIRVRGFEGAKWEWTYTVKGGSARHVQEAEFRDDSGTAYTLYESSPEQDAVAGSRLFTEVLNSFSPTH